MQGLRKIGEGLTVAFPPTKDIKWIVARACSSCATLMVPVRNFCGLVRCVSHGMTLLSSDVPHGITLLGSDVSRNHFSTVRKIVHDFSNTPSNRKSFLHISDTLLYPSNHIVCKSVEGVVHSQEVLLWQQCTDNGGSERRCSITLAEGILGISSVLRRGSSVSESWAGGTGSASGKVLGLLLDRSRWWWHCSSRLRSFPARSLSLRALAVQCCGSRAYCWTSRCCLCLLFC